MAVILGVVSGGLVCRDFDTMKEYEAWAANHPELAKTLPTVATSRGRHVYFRAAPADLIFVDLRNVDPPEDGEYRGDAGHYCLLPPSRHPDGPTYTWLIPLPDGEIPFVADVRAAGFLPSHVTERSDPDIDRDPETIPSGIGRRNRQVFEFARALKAIPALADAPVDGMKPHVRRWHKMGFDRAVIGTEPFDETWIDFLHAWPKVKFPKGNEPIIAILERARHLPPPVAAQDYEGDGLRLLVAICRELQCAIREQAVLSGVPDGSHTVGAGRERTRQGMALAGFAGP